MGIVSGGDFSLEIFAAGRFSGWGGCYNRTLASMSVRMSVRPQNVSTIRMTFGMQVEADE